MTDNLYHSLLDDEHTLLNDVDNVARDYNINIIKQYIDKYFKVSVAAAGFNSYKPSDFTNIYINENNECVVDILNESQNRILNSISLIDYKGKIFPSENFIWGNINTELYIAQCNLYNLKKFPKKCDTLKIYQCSIHSMYGCPLINNRLYIYDCPDLKSTKYIKFNKDNLYGSCCVIENCNKLININSIKKISPYIYNCNQIEKI